MLKIPQWSFNWFTSWKFVNLKFFKLFIVSIPLYRNVTTSVHALRYENNIVFECVHSCFAQMSSGASPAVFSSYSSRSSAKTIPKSLEHQRPGSTSGPQVLYVWNNKTCLYCSVPQSVKRCSRNMRRWNHWAFCLYTGVLL